MKEFIPKERPDLSFVKHYPICNTVMANVYDRQCREICMCEFSYIKQIGEEDEQNYSIVCKDDIKGGFISTVWLGIDHNFRDGDPPLIFETMVFMDDYKHPWQNMCFRYSTEKSAWDGHHRLLETIKTVVYGADLSDIQDIMEDR